MLKLWDRTQKNIKERGIAALDSSPAMLVTNRPDIKSLRDFKPEDKIALSIPRVSLQAVFLEMAAAQAFGADKYAALDAQTLSMKHPDAVAALLPPGPRSRLISAVRPIRSKCSRTPACTRSSIPSRSWAGR
jgi:NitT/TauT family transport system substrate-binding protein